MRKIFLILTFLISIFLMFGVSAQSADKCELEAELINQDPYPAVPGEYVKVVFQLNGINDPDCGEVVFELLPQYPFSLDPGKSAVVKVQGGTFARNYQSHLIAPYELRIDKDAVDGDNVIEVRYSGHGVNSQLYEIQMFNISVEDLRTDFEVSVRDYNPTTGMITFDILNIGKNDIEALTVEIPEQENIQVKGSNRNIIGSLDSNDDTTFSFEAVPKEGEIMIKVIYTDEINVRRNVEKTVFFNPSNFEGRNGQSSGASIWVWIILVLILVGLFFWWRARKKRKERQRMKHHHEMK